MTFSRFKDKILDPRVVLAVWSVMTLLSGLIKALGGPAKYNNFLVFRGVSDHLFASLPLYEHYPLEYHDLNHYGPIFGFIIAPFAYIPPVLAVPLWVASMSALLYWTVRKLPLSVRLTTLVLWIALNDMYLAGLMQQFNIAVAALLVGSLVMIQRRREGWAALFIVVGAMVKVYGIVGLAFFFFVQRKWRFIGYMAAWSVVALLLPLVAVSPEYLLSQYKAWIVDLAAKNGENMFCDYTNISFVGAVRKISGSSTYSDLWIMVPAMVTFLLSYLRFGQYKRMGFQLTMLASLLLFIVLFSSGSENSGYVIASIGVGIWWVTLKRRGWLEGTLLALAFVASFSRNLFPYEFYREVIVHYALRSLPYMAIWLHCSWRLLHEDFAASYAGEQSRGEDPEQMVSGFDALAAKHAANPAVPAVVDTPESDPAEEQKVG